MLETYPAIEAQAQREGAEVLGAEEGGVQADKHHGYGYARVGQRATMDVPRSHLRVNQISAISNEGTVRFMKYQCALNAAVFLTFLARLIAGASRKVLLIVDRLQAHKTPEVQAWVEAHRDRIEVFYLPAYSPELNPVEYLNNDMKGAVNQAGLPPDRPTLRDRLSEARFAGDSESLDPFFPRHRSALPTTNAMISCQTVELAALSRKRVTLKHTDQKWHVFTPKRGLGRWSGFEDAKMMGVAFNHGGQTQIASCREESLQVATRDIRQLAQSVMDQVLTQFIGGKTEHDRCRFPGECLGAKQHHGPFPGSRYLNASSQQSVELP